MTPLGDGDSMCWWVWLLLLLLLCCCLLLLLLCCFRLRRPYILIRVDKAGRKGKTKRDEKIIKVPVTNEKESMLAVMNALLKSKKLTLNEREQLGKTQYLGLFFGEHGPLVMDGNHKLSDYQVEPLSASNLRGKTKREKRLRREHATLDVREALTSNPLAEYSPRTKISLMSRIGDLNSSTEQSLKDRQHVHHLLKTGIGSMQHMELPTAKQNKKKATSFRSLQTDSSSASAKGVSIEMSAIEPEDAQEVGRASLTRNDSLSAK